MTGPGGTEVPEVPHGPVIMRVENADLKSMPHYTRGYPEVPGQIEYLFYLLSDMNENLTS